MSDHSESCDESRALCDALFRGLSQKISDLQASRSMRWCGFFQSGRKRFAYINHRKTMARIEVWCLGEPGELAANPSLAVVPRTPTSGGFGEQFQARFLADGPSEIDAAIELLYRLSYPLS